MLSNHRVRQLIEEWDADDRAKVWLDPEIHICNPPAQKELGCPAASSEAVDLSPCEDCGQTPCKHLAYA